MQVAVPLVKVWREPRVNTRPGIGLRRFCDMGVSAFSTGFDLIVKNLVNLAGGDQFRHLNCFYLDTRT
jgi:hypothetical protein